MKKNYKIGITLALIALALMAGGELLAQCPMCRMSAESNLKNGGMDGRGLNAGILYMFSLPYLLVAAIGIWWWRNRQAVASEPGNEQVNDRARLN